MPLVNAIQSYLEPFLSGLKPDPDLTVTEWADAHRFLSQKSAAEPGRYRSSRTPFAVEIMNELSPGSAAEEIWFMKGAQVGGTEIGTNWLGFIIGQAPAPTLMVQPTVELAKRYSKQRMAPMIETCPQLTKKVKAAKERDSGNTQQSKEFDGGILVLTGANSAVGLRSMPARNLFLDEIDAYPGDVEGEGDPVNLAKARARTFARRKIFLVSTPKLETTSRINAGYNGSDKRRFHVPCPHCEHMQWIKWPNIVWEKDKPETAALKCEECAKLIPEHRKTWMLERGKWIAENPGVKRGKVVGFHLSSLYSPLGWYSWATAAKEFLEAKGNSDKLKSFCNLVLGETWAEKGDAPEWKRIYDRRESYAAHVELPEQVLFITAGIDVQKDRIELEFQGWSEGKRSWSLDFVSLGGDPNKDEVWEKLEAQLSRDFMHPSGVILQPLAAALDTGYLTQKCYDWLRKQSSSKIFGIKGSESLPMVIGTPSFVDVNYQGVKIKRGLRLWPVGTNHTKSELYGWLKLETPLAGETTPPGFCHFPEYDARYFQGLCAEQLVLRKVKGYSKYVWEKVFERNEPLDCRVYGRAAAAWLGIDRLTDEQWSELRARVTPKESEADGEPEPTPAPKGTGFIKKHRPFWNRK